MAVADHTRAEPASAAVAAERAPRSSWALAAALAVVVVYAAAADGAIEIPQETRLQIGVALVSLFTLAGLLFGTELRFTPDRRAGAGLWLLAGFTVWSALSLIWSIAPDEAWLEANRAVAYTLLVFLGMVLGSSLPRAAERVAIGFLGIATAIALYAVAGKVLPTVFDHATDLSRLRAPLFYWNALAIFLVFAVPVAIQVAADRRLSNARRLAGMLALLPLLLAIALTYSRGGIIALFIAVGVQFAFSRERLRLFLVFLTGAVAITPALVVSGIRDDLTENGLDASTIADDGALLGVVLLLGALFAVAVGRLLIRAGDGPRLGRRGVLAARRAAVLAGVAAVVAAVVLTASGWTGDQVESFTETHYEPAQDQERLIQTSSGNRWVWWEEAAGAAWDEPLTGHGAGSFPLLHLAYRDNDLEVRQVHSVPLEFLAETGVVGAVLGLGGLALLLIAAIARTRWRVGSDRAYAAALTAAVVAFGFHVFFDWDWDIPGVMVPVLIFLGVLGAMPPEDRPPRERSYGGRGLLLAGAGLALAAICISAALPALARDESDEALQLSASDDPAELRDAAEKAELASKLDPFAVDPLFAAAAVARQRGQDRLAVRHLIDAVDRQPENPRAWLRLTGYQLRLGDVAAALESRENAAKLDPRSPLSLVAASVANYDEGASATAVGTPLPLIVEPPEF